MFVTKEDRDQQKVRMYQTEQDAYEDELLKQYDELVTRRSGGKSMRGSGGRMSKLYHHSGESAQIARIDHSLESVKFLEFDDDVYGIRVNDFQDYLKDRINDEFNNQIQIERKQRLDEIKGKIDIRQPQY